MPRGNPVHRVGIVRDLDAPNRQLLSKSYRARSAAKGGFGRPEPLRKLLGGADQRPPETLPGGRVAGGEDLPATRVQHGEPFASPGGLAKAARQRVQRADPAQRQVAGEGKCLRGGDPDPQPGEGSRPDSDCDPLDLLPTTRDRDHPLDLRQQHRSMQRAAALGGADERFVEDLTVADRASGGVGGRAVEADYGQRCGTKKLKAPTRLPLTNQVTRWLPGMLVVILLT